MNVKVALILGALCTNSLLLAQTQYTDDDEPTALEEEIRWLVNRGRFDSNRENIVRSTAYADVPVNSPPLAIHHGITLACRHHSEDMARNNKFQHATVPGSAYYDPVTQPNPWDRMKAEGYNWNSAAENIAAGYSSAEAAYIGWWNSEGHRRNMYNSGHREIGNGYFFLSGSSYSRYYTMGLGRSGSTHFFTDTIFADTDQDGRYDQGEGRPNIRIHLRIANADHIHYDISTTSGSFAIPIQTIADGARVEVHLTNSGATPVSLSVPRNYDEFSESTLAPQEILLIGTFIQPSTATNVGFRNLTPPAPPQIPPHLAVTSESGQLHLRWQSIAGQLYQVQWTEDGFTWTPLSTPRTGTGGELSVTDSLLAPAFPYRFYRVTVE